MKKAQQAGSRPSETRLLSGSGATLHDPRSTRLSHPTRGCKGGEAPMAATPQTALIQDVAPGQPLAVRRLFTQPGVHPFESVEWETRDARIGHGDKVAFHQAGVEFPSTWSQNSTNIVAQKYFRGQLDSPTRERSVKQMISRVAGTIADWGRERGYFATREDGDAFEAELGYILLHQMAAFNSPVWFNVGFEEHP